MKQVFELGIRHEALFLWDAWCVQEDGIVNLFALSIPRYDLNGHPISPDNRNAYPFSVQRFLSHDMGVTWRAMGVHRRPNPSCLYQSGNIWSGSVACMNGSLLEAFTGIKVTDEAHPYVQSLYLAELDSQFNETSVHCLMSSERDYELIKQSGYSLQPKEHLGSVHGEADGSITAWRDPFIFGVNGKTLICFAAKSVDGKPAMGLLTLAGDRYDDVCLMSPVTLPDTSDFTQLEVPKIVYVDQLSCFLLLCSTTNRQSETQPANEVDTLLRLYVSSDIQGPWRSAGTSSSIIAGVDMLFGAAIMGIDDREGRLICVAPYTSEAGNDCSLSFAPRFFIDLADIGTTQQICAYFE